MESPLRWLFGLHVQRVCSFCQASRFRLRRNLNNKNGPKGDVSGHPPFLPMCQEAYSRLKLGEALKIVDPDGFWAPMPPMPLAGPGLSILKIISRGYVPGGQLKSPWHFVGLGNAGRRSATNCSKDCVRRQAPLPVGNGLLCSVTNFRLLAGPLDGHPAPQF